MGVQFSVNGYECNASWSYGGFMAFRNRLAQSIGLDLDEMQGFRKRHPTDEGYIRPGWRSWEYIMSPLKHFLNAPDDDHDLSTETCRCIYPILSQIIEQWEAIDAWDYDHIQGRNLVLAMKYCAENNKALHWS